MFDSTVIRGDDPARPLALVRWLWVVAVLVVLIVAVGGVTRLTESGLSITEWKPVTGAIPPLSDAQWQAEFDRYRQIPQYTEVNGPAGMTLADYKFIYFWEWVHRLLARLIGLAFALPLAWFWVKRQIPAGYKPRLLALLALGGLQGAVGWWMVSSGLTQDVKVSHFRLAAHLLVALVTLGGITWTALDLSAVARGEPR
jgi:heme a synthase